MTDFGDQAVVLPVAAAVFAGLLVVGWRRGAAAWGVSVGGVLAVMLVLKVVVFACGRLLPIAGLVSPSGHTAAAAVVYGGMLALLAPASRAGTLVATAAGGAVALVFGLTRLALEVHTVPDVVVGAAVGVAGAVAMRLLAGARPRLAAAPWLVVPALAAMLLFHGTRLEAETRLRWAAAEMWPLSACRAAPGLMPEGARATLVNTQSRKTRSDDS